MSLIIVSCGGSESVDLKIDESSTTTSIFSTTSSSSTTIFENPLLIKNYEELPDALVRIVVKSTQAEINENFEIEIFEYEGSGSGFFISDDGYIVTNNHVVSGAVTIEVFTSDRTQPYIGKLIGSSECDDLAVLKIAKKDTRFINLSEEDPRLGAEIIAAGFPKGDPEITYLNGIVSKRQTDGSSSFASIEYAFEHTAEILPGSSGGPIVNTELEVIGIAYAGNEDRQEFGIPIVVVKDKIYEIIDGKFDYTFKANIEQIYGAGLYVYSVESDSPLKSAGFLGGEIITDIKDLSVVNESTMKLYCDAINARSSNIGINFKGLSLQNLESFNVEVSLDGSVVNMIERSSLTTTTSSSTTTTSTTIAKLDNKYEYEVPTISRIDTETISDFQWKIKIYLNYLEDNNSNYFDGIENIKHCNVELFAYPYTNKYDPFSRFGQLQRYINCSSERINKNEVLVTHIFNLDPNSFDWSQISTNEIPIARITLYPEYSLNTKESQDFTVRWLFGYGGYCYNKDSCSSNISRLGGAPQRMYTDDAGPYRWINGFELKDISGFQSNNYCSSNYSNYQSYGDGYWWYIPNNAACIKK